MKAGRVSGGVVEVQVACEDGQKEAGREGSSTLSRYFDEVVASAIRGKLAKVSLSIVWEGCW
jgi:hypothetical protein